MDYRRQSGFTLIEILIVVAIIAMLAQVVASNFHRLVPKASLDRSASKLVTQLDFMRSEARLNSRPYRLEFDLTNDRYRVHLPPEERLTSDQVIDPSIDADAMMWQELDEDRVVDLAGIRIKDGSILRSGLYEMVFDETGFTADHAFYVKLHDQDAPVYSIHYYGLAGTSRVLIDEEGNEQHPDDVTEGDF